MAVIFSLLRPNLQLLRGEMEAKLVLLNAALASLPDPRSDYGQTIRSYIMVVENLRDTIDLYIEQIPAETVDHE